VLKHALDFPHWLTIGGALLVLVGLVGTALQKNERLALRQVWSNPKYVTGNRCRSPSWKNNTDRT
jgi:hypothetical protein